jgi:hypothetical protein
MALHDAASNETQRMIAGWSASAGLRLAPARVVPKKEPRWLLSVATLQQSREDAA